MRRRTLLAPRASITRTKATYAGGFYYTYYTFDPIPAQGDLIVFIITHDGQEVVLDCYPNQVDSILYKGAYTFGYNSSVNISVELSHTWATYTWPSNANRKEQDYKLRPQAAYVAYKQYPTIRAPIYIR